MPSAGRTSMPTSGPEPFTSTLDVTLRLAGSIVTIDLPSTRPMIQPAAWAPVATALDATTAPVSTSTFILANMGVAPLQWSEDAGGEAPPPTRPATERARPGCRAATDLSAAAFTYS